MSPAAKRARAARLRAVALCGACWLSIVGSAWACPVCFSAKNEENQIAYLATTGFLTFLPLIMIGGLVLWVRRKVSELAELGQAGSEDVGPVSSFSKAP